MIESNQIAMLTRDRKPEHDIGSVDGIVRQYLRQKSALGTKAAAVKKTTLVKGKR
jgi:hypothetical protein